MTANNGWDQHKNLVMAELARLEGEIKSVREDYQNDMKDTMIEIKQLFAVQKSDTQSLRDERSQDMREIKTAIEELKINQAIESERGSRLERLMWMVGGLVITGFGGALLNLVIH